MSKIGRKLLSIAIGAAAMIGAASPANAWYAVYYMNSSGVITGYHFYCDNGADIPEMFGGPYYSGTDTGYDYYYDNHYNEPPC